MSDAHHDHKTPKLLERYWQQWMKRILVENFPSMHMMKSFYYSTFLIRIIRHEQINTHHQIPLLPNTYNREMWDSIFLTNVKKSTCLNQSNNHSGTWAFPFLWVSELMHSIWILYHSKKLNLTTPISSLWNQGQTDPKDPILEMRFKSRNLYKIALPKEFGKH